MPVPAIDQISPRIIARLGADHVAWVLRFGELAHGVASSRAVGQWDANNVESCAAYNALADEIAGSDAHAADAWTRQWYAYYRGRTDVQGTGWGENDSAYQARILKDAQGREVGWAEGGHRIYVGSLS